MNWAIKRPFVPVALAYVAGILLADQISLRLGWLFGITFAVAVLALAWGKGRPWLLAPLLLLLGAVNLIRETAIVSPADFREILGQRTELAAVRGRLAETPYYRVYDQNAEPAYRTFAQVDVSDCQFKHRNWQPATGRVAVSLPGRLPENYHAGQLVEISGVLQPPRRPVAPELFDYRNFLRRAGIYYQLETLEEADWKLLPPVVPPPVSDQFLDWAKEILRLDLPAEDETLQLLWTMTLGWKTVLTGDVAEPFMRSGTMHIFAISGLHIALIAGILVALLRVLRVPRGVCGIVVLPLIWFYTGATGWQASAIRSTVMMTVIIGGWSLRRPSDLLNSLAVAGGIILVWQPQQLFQASFQLSFFVVLSLGLFTPVLEQLRARWLEAEPLVPAAARPRWQNWLRTLAGWVTAGLTTSLAAWLGSIPLVAYYFHLFSPVSLLANLIVVPLSSLALASNLASLLVGGWWPGLAGLFNHSSWFWMWAMERVSVKAAALPGGCFQVGTPTPLFFLGYYATLLAVMGGWLRLPRWRGWVGLGLAVLLLMGGLQWEARRKITRLTVLPLGGGNAVFVDAPGAADLLVDCGAEVPAELVLKPFLRARGVNRLPQLVLTHGDTRSVGAATLISTAFAEPQVFTSEVSFRSPTYREIVNELRRTPLRWQPMTPGGKIGDWRVLHPPADFKFSRSDDAAMVLLGEIRGIRILLLSDLGVSGQRALLASGADLRADVVVGGLPTEGEPLGEALLNVVRPQVIVVADSEFPASRRAGEKLRARLAARAVPVIYTRHAGSVTVEFRPDGTELRAMDGTRLEL